MVQTVPVNFRDPLGLLTCSLDGVGVGCDVVLPICGSPGEGLIQTSGPPGACQEPDPNPYDDDWENGTEEYVRIPRLTVKDDCYWAKGTGYISGWTRVISYQVVDQEGRPYYGDEVPTVRETVTPTGGVKITGNGVWQRSNNTISANGTFVDFLSSNGRGTGTADQVFRINGVAVNVNIGKGNPSVLHNTYTNNGVIVNGTTSPRPCKEGDPVAR